MQIEKRIGREKKRCGYAPFNSAQQAIKLRSLRSLRPSGKLPSATCFIAGPLCAISPQRALALGAAHRAQQEEPKTECRRKKYEIRRMGQKQSYSFQVESP